MGMLRTIAVKLIFFMVNMGAFGNPIKNNPNNLKSEDIILPPSEMLSRVGVNPDLRLSANTPEHTNPPEDAWTTTSSQDGNSPQKPDADIEEAATYPTEMVKQALKTAPSIIKDFLKLPLSVLPDSLDHQISKRNTEPEDEFTLRLCPIEVVNYTLTYRHSADRGDDETFYLPLVGSQELGASMLPTEFQKVEVQICDRRNNGLNAIGTLRELHGRDYWCKQEYVRIPMVAMARNSTPPRLAIKKFRIPSSCSCYMRP